MSSKKSTQSGNWLTEVDVKKMVIKINVDWMVAVVKTQIQVFWTHFFFTKLADLELLIFNLSLQLLNFLQFGIEF